TLKSCSAFNLCMHKLNAEQLFNVLAVRNEEGKTALFYLGGDELKNVPLHILPEEKLFDLLKVRDPETGETAVFSREYGWKQQELNLNRLTAPHLQELLSVQNNAGQTCLFKAPTGKGHSLSLLESDALFDVLAVQ